MYRHESWVRVAAVVALLCIGSSAALAVSVVNVDVEQFNFDNNSIDHPTNPSIALTIPAGEAASAGPALTPRIRGGNRGDYDISWDANGSDDTADVIYGVQLSFAAQNHATWIDASGLPKTNVVTTATAVSGSLDTLLDIKYFTPVFSAGTGVQGSEWNSNIAAAYFPFSEGWVAGSGYVSDGTNGAAFDIMNAGAARSYRFEYR